MLGVVCREGGKIDAGEVEEGVFVVGTEVGTCLERVSEGLYIQGGGGGPDRSWR